jgi:putative flippase GtrA
VPKVENRAWFFDTELLVLAQREGLRIHEVPVDWTDDPDSRVQLIPTALEDLRGVWRLVRSRPSRFQRFAVVGITTTIAYALIYLAVEQIAPAWFANGLALVTTAGANTAANRRFTFGVRGREGVVGDFGAGMVVFLLALLTTTTAAGLLHTLAPRAGDLVEVGALTIANLGATVCRFLILRGWMDSRSQIVAANGA